MKSLLDIMARLRDPQDGCPWDLKQTFETIVPYTIEEAYEVADAIERKDVADLKDELGDLLLQVVFYAQIAKESGQFDFDDVIAAISDKMIRRHPHVFADERIDDAEEQRQAWEAHKLQERHSKDRQGLLDGIALALPALIRAQKLQGRAARVGFDWPDVNGVKDKIEEELVEIDQAVALNDQPEKLVEEVGDLLFTCVNLARHYKVDAETALRAANKKFERRFSQMEKISGERDLSACTSDELEQLWRQAKLRD